jgi:CarD family transcriptional regulator
MTMSTALYAPTLRLADLPKPDLSTARLTDARPFAVGDLVAYPTHGVAKVASIESKAVGTASLEVYHLEARASGLKIIVPVAKAAENGMRALASEVDIEDMLEILRDHEVPTDRQTWNRRHRGFMEKIRTGSLFEVAEVFRDLALLRTTKVLSHGEKQMLRTARDLLAGELAVVRGQSSEEVALELEAMFSH